MIDHIDEGNARYRGIPFMRDHHRIDHTDTDGKNLLEGFQFVLNSWFVAGTDDDDILDAGGVEGCQRERKHAAQAGPHHREAVDAEVIKHLDL